MNRFHLFAEKKNANVRKRCDKAGPKAKESESLAVKPFKKLPEATNNFLCTFRSELVRAVDSGLKQASRRFRQVGRLHYF